MRLLRPIPQLAAIASLAFASTPVLADAITLGSGSVGQSWDFAFNGYSGSAIVSGLTSTAKFTQISDLKVTRSCFSGLVSHYQHILKPAEITQRCRLTNPGGQVEGIIGRSLTVCIKGNVEIAAHQRHLALYEEGIYSPRGQRRCFISQRRGTSHIPLDQPQASKVGEGACIVARRNCLDKEGSGSRRIAIKDRRQTAQPVGFRGIAVSHCVSCHLRRIAKQRGLRRQFSLIRHAARCSKLLERSTRAGAVAQRQHRLGLQKQ